MSLSELSCRWSCIVYGGLYFTYPKNGMVVCIRLCIYVSVSFWYLFLHYCAALSFCSPFSASLHFTTSRSFLLFRRSDRNAKCRASKNLFLRIMDVIDSSICKWIWTISATVQCAKYKVAIAQAVPYSVATLISFTINVKSKKNQPVSAAASQWKFRKSVFG